MIEKVKIEYEKAVLIGLITQNQDLEKSNEYLDELEFLTFTAGGRSIEKICSKISDPKFTNFFRFR